jgi:uncharacterized membrane protein
MAEEPPEQPKRRLIPVVLELCLIALILASPLPQKFQDFERELWRKAPYSEEEINDPWGMYQVRTKVALVVMVGGLILLPVLLGVGVCRLVRRVKSRKSPEWQDYSEDE